MNLATIATGLAPSSHGILGYQLHLPDVGDGVVANTIKWTTLWGDPLPIDTGALLPRPNLWERLAAAGIEPVTVQPANFTGSPLSRMLYRGCRFEGVNTLDELATASTDLAGDTRAVGADVPSAGRLCRPRVGPGFAGVRRRPRRRSTRCGAGWRPDSARA